MPRIRLRHLALAFGGLLFNACVHGKASLFEPCPEDTTDCDGTCIDTSADLANCGECGATCAAGESCAAGVCGLDCGDETRCGDVCIDIVSDPNNCGACDNICAADKVCGNAECLDNCPSGTTECGASCVDIDTDEDHCGGCDAACGVEQSCTGAMCYAESCRVLLEADPSLVDGLYTVDPDGTGGEPPFEVACDMSTDGGGWFQLQLDDSDNVVMAESTSINNWQKCDDDSALHFDWIAEANVAADATGTLDQEIDLGYLNPITATPHSAAQVEAMRGAISELSITTRMVANTVDDDNGDWQNAMITGLEVYIMGASMMWTLLTPGNDGECGGSDGVPLPGTSAGYYLWHNTAAGSGVDGTTGLTDADITGLGIGDLLPSKVRVVVQSGGGVAFGWEKEVFLVR
jgi:Stigma-specific protein, Stig1